VTAREPFRAIGDIAYGLCVPRVEQDTQLVATARERGADVREKARCGKCSSALAALAGSATSTATVTSNELRARLVVGADGRRSTIAAAVGAWWPYRSSRHGRGMVFRYLDDPHADAPAGETMWQLRRGDTIAFVFPCTPRGRLLVLFMGPRADVKARQSGELFVVLEQPAKAFQRAHDPALDPIADVITVQVFHTIRLEPPVQPRGVRAAPRHPVDVHCFLLCGHPQSPFSRRSMRMSAGT
jgi:2-polyprenyl-6-methoxyphenol hydroxylase-like FAD-dependent oxidoreductase